MSSKFWVEEIPTGSIEDMGHDEMLVEPKIQETRWPANAEPSGKLVNEAAGGHKSRQTPNLSGQGRQAPNHLGRKVDEVEDRSSHKGRQTPNRRGVGAWKPRAL